MTNAKYDVVIVGAGPGGYVGAIRAAQLGLKAAIVERAHLGGVCLNWGCIPTKALLRSAEVYRTLQHAAEYGLSASGVGFDLAEMVKRSRGVSARLNGGVRALLEKNKVDVIWGEATLARSGEVTVKAPGSGAVAPKGALGAGTYQARHVVIATGARPVSLPGAAIDGKVVWGYADALVPDKLPKSLLVVGAGAIGVELASFYATFGSAVTLVEAQGQVLPAEDAEIAAVAARAYREAGIRILTGARVASVRKGSDSVTAVVEVPGQQPEQVTADRMICAIGVTGNTEGLGLEACGVGTSRGIISVDAFGRTNVPGIYAIGDVAGPPMLAHKAEHEAIACIEKIAGLDPHPLQRDMIPGCTYSLPQVARVGLTEAQAKQQGWDIKVGRFPFAANGKAVALGETQGLVKTIYDRATGRLLGAHMVGAEVTELIHGYVVAMNLETTDAAMAQTIFPHPTLSEMIHESTLAASGRAIHIA